MPALRFEARPIYTIDAFDRLVEVNRAFIDSLSNAPVKLCGPALIGRSIWDFVPGFVPRQLWQVLYQRVRAIGAPVFVPLRSDGPGHRSLVDVELHPVGDRSIRHVRERVTFEPRAAVSLLDPNYPRDSREILRCAWCARIQICLGQWEEIEQAHSTLRLGATLTLPRLQDSACVDCKQAVLKTFPARVA
jgi:hypothetical protein